MKVDPQDFIDAEFPFSVPPAVATQLTEAHGSDFIDVTPHGTPRILIATRKAVLSGLFTATFRTSIGPTQVIPAEALFSLMGWEFPITSEVAVSRLLRWGRPSALLERTASESIVALPLAAFIHDLAAVCLPRLNRAELAELVRVARACVVGSTPTRSLPGLRECISARLHAMDYRHVRVFRCRSGIDGGAALTLEEVGKRMDVSRERVRQIESRVYERLGELRPQWIGAAVADFIRNDGQRIIELSSPRMAELRILSRLLRLESYESAEAGIAGFGIGAKQFERLQWKDWGYRTLFGGSGLAEILSWKGGLVWSDVVHLRDCFRALRRSELSEMDRVQFSLEHLGRPGHYSEIAAVYNELFPESRQTDRNVHATLGRMKSVVYIGVKGTYGLVADGAIRPETQIYSLVPEVLQRLYSLIPSPLPFDVILSEVRKVRPNADQTSVRMVLNQTAIRESNDRWIPEVKVTPRFSATEFKSKY